MAEKDPKDTVKEVVSILKTALEQLQDNSASLNLHPEANSVIPQSQQPKESLPHQRSFSDAVRRDFSLSFPSIGGGGKKIPLTNSTRETKRAKVMFQPRKSWTHDFCLLSEPNCYVTPSVQKLAKLKEAGLGMKHIVFPDKKAVFLKMKQVLQTEYPKLTTQDGVFEFLRAERWGNHRPLILIPIPSAGYSISYIKEMVGPGTLIYIRPMKTAISSEKQADTSTSDSPTTECIKCNNIIPISNLRQHSLVCNTFNAATNVSCADDGSSMASTSSGATSNDICSKEVVTLSDDDAGPSRVTWSTQLKQIFPEVKQEDLEDAALLSSSLEF